MKKNENTGQQNWLFFFLKQNHLFLYNFGSLSPNQESVFFHHVRISQYCQFHGCQVWKLVFRVFLKNYGRYRKFDPIWRFQIKFCAFKKKEIENRISRSWDIGHLSWRKSEKTTFFEKIFSFLNFFSYLKTPKDV